MYKLARKSLISHKTKADVVAPLKKSVEEGAALIKEMGDAGMGQPIKFPYAGWAARPSASWTLPNTRASITANTRRIFFPQSIFLPR